MDGPTIFELSPDLKYNLALSLKASYSWKVAGRTLSVAVQRVCMINIRNSGLRSQRMAVRWVPPSDGVPLSTPKQAFHRERLGRALGTYIEYEGIVSAKDFLHGQIAG